jgi:hypothetical protein
MRNMFNWTTRNSTNSTLIGWLKEAEDNISNIPEDTASTHSSTCTLTILTYVADVKKLHGRLGFCAHKYDNGTDHIIHDIYSTSHHENGHASVLLDSWNPSVEHHDLEKLGKYKLVRIGQGQRVEHPQDKPIDGKPLEWVSLLVEQKGNHYERIGLTTISNDHFEWKLQWISIV